MNNVNDGPNYSEAIGMNGGENIDEPENVLLESMDPSRVCAEMNEIPAQLEEILKNVYDLSSNGRDFNSVLNSTMSAGDPRLFNGSLNSNGNDFPLNFSSDSSSLYVTAPTGNTPESSLYVATSHVPTQNNNYLTHAPLLYNRPENCENYMEYLLDQKTYNTSVSGNTVTEDDNDPSPVYLNFNIQNVAQSAQSFNTEFEKYTNQAMPSHEGDRPRNDVVNYVEYMNNIEEAWQPKLVPMNGQRNAQIFQPIPTNIMPSPLSKYPMRKVYSFPQDLEKLNGSYVTQIMSPYQQLNSNAMAANFSEAQRSNALNVQRNIISRKPLQTKLSIKINNNEWAVINNSPNDAAEETCTDNELMAIEQVEPDIPFIKNRSTGHKRRKQTLTPLANNEISFLNAKGEFSKFEASTETPVAGLNPQIDTTFITFRKKPKKEIESESLEDSAVSAGRNFNSTKHSQRDALITNMSSNSSTILISSDSDSENDTERQDPKCLKCGKCKKMFKTSRSYSIHKKRCDAPPSNLENAYVLEIEYLDSEKEDDFDQICDPDSKDSALTKFQNENIEIVESDAIDLLDSSKQSNTDEMERSDENVLRRNTRSSSLKTNSVPASSSSSLNSPITPALRKQTKNINLNCLDLKAAGTVSCEVCGKKFRQKSCLAAHKRVHEKVYKCQYCLKVFQLKSTYDTHVLEKCDKIPSVKLKRLRSAMTKTNAK